jgi:hypothetical protein
LIGAWRSPKPINPQYLLSSEWFDFNPRLGTLAGLLSGLDALFRLGRTATEPNRFVASLDDMTVVRESIE